MADNEYYDVDFTPLIGCYYINIMLGEYNETVPLYKIFLMFPLLFDDDFLKHIYVKKRTKEFYKLVNSYADSKELNNFWIEYNIKFSSSRIFCFDSIYFGLKIGAFELNDEGIKNKRNLYNEIPINVEDIKDKIMCIRKIGNAVHDMEIYELLRIMKVGDKA